MASEPLLILRPTGVKVVLVRGSNQPLVVKPVQTSTVIIKTSGIVTSGGVGSIIDGVFDYSPPTPMTEWIINHNFGYIPVSVQVFSPGMLEVNAEIQHMNTNQTRIRFSEPYTGLARLI